MAKTDLANFTLPSNPVDRKKIRDIFYEMSGINQFIKDKREDLKSYVEVLQNDYGIPKKVISKVAKIIEDQNYDDFSEEASAVETIYEVIMLNNTTSNDTASDDSDDDQDI